VDGGSAVNVGNAVSVGRNKSTVGDGSGVFVRVKVPVGISVGGGNVFVGTAARVCATAVDAMTTTVFSRSSWLIAGAVGAAPQALASKTSKTTEPILTRRNYPLLTTILSLKMYPSDGGNRNGSHLHMEAESLETLNGAAFYRFAVALIKVIGSQVLSW
jgi:hypothetical protein